MLFSTLALLVSVMFLGQLTQGTDFAELPEGAPAHKLTTRSTAPKKVAPLFQTTSIRQGRYYLFSLGPVPDAIDARKVCYMYGGYLAEVNDKAEFTFFENFGYKRWPEKKNSFYIAGTDAKEEGTWKWPRTSEIAFTPWAKGRPMKIGQYRDCLMLKASSEQSPLRLFDVTCTGPRRFICEIPVQH